jgi:hypothetical protein
MLFDNIISGACADKIADEIGGELFPWVWNGYTVNEDENLNNYQFTHRLFSNGVGTSEKFHIVLPILKAFEQRAAITIKNVIRVKANLLTNGIYTDADLSKSIHIDSHNENHISLIYYVIDSDGDTVFFDDSGVISESISPVKSNLCWFKSNIKHRATAPKLNKRRLVVNFVIAI